MLNDYAGHVTAIDYGDWAPCDADSMEFDYEWIDAVTLGVWHRGATRAIGWRPVGRVTIYEDDPHFCSVSVNTWTPSGLLAVPPEASIWHGGADRVVTYRDIDLGEDSDPDSPLFMGNAADFACEWIEAIVTGRPLPVGGEC